MNAPQEQHWIAGRAAWVLLLGLSSCATASSGRPHEDQLSAWYHRIQMQEARIEVSKNTLEQAATQAQRQEALIAINDAARRICDTAVLIGETDAELRCQLARRYQALSSQDP